MAQRSERSERRRPLKRLPKSGEDWPETERKLWLQLLESSFKLIYKEAAN
jgi:hypothetical protein